MTGKFLIPLLLVTMSGLAETKTPVHHGKVIAFKVRDSFSELGQSGTAGPQAPGTAQKPAAEICDLWVRDGNDVYQAQWTKGCNTDNKSQWSEGQKVNFRVDGKYFLVYEGSKETAMDLMNVSEYDAAAESNRGNVKVLTTMPPKKK